MTSLWFNLRWRLLLLYMAIVALLLSGGGVLIHDQAQNILLDSRAEQARAAVYWAVSHSEPVGQLKANDPDSVAERLFVSPSPDLSFFLLDKTGQLLQTLGQGTASSGAPSLPPDLAGAIKQKTDTTAISRSGESGHRALVYLFPVVDAGGSLQGFVQAEAALGSVDAALARLRWVLFSVLGLSFLVACALWFVFTKASLKPIEELARTSRSVAAGDLSRRVAVPRGRDELYHTASTFNNMLDSIEDYLAREKQNQEQMKRFLADAAHELRSPLTVLRGYADILLQQGKDNQETLEHSLEMMSRTINRLTRLTNDLLTLSRLDAGMELKMAPVDLNPLCQEVCQVARDIAEGKDITLQQGPRLTVMADSELLRRVLWVVMDNAIHYTGPTGKITVTTSAEDSLCRITVQDDGQGIPAGHLPHVFERFYRATRSRSEGTGLGLPIARAIVEAHGGRVTIQSAAGRGTTVTIRLPVVG